MTLAWRESPLKQYPSTRKVFLADGRFQSYTISCNDPARCLWYAESFTGRLQAYNMPSIDAATQCCETWEAESIAKADAAQR
jgi:hypothetical protein